MDQQSIEAGQQELQDGHQLLQRARQLQPSESFTEGLELIAEMIRIGRRLNHRRFHGARSAEDVRELEGAASDLSRALLQAAAAKASNLSLAILRGTERTPAEILKLAKLLDSVNEFATARRILERARLHAAFGADAKIKTQILQKAALYTYKDVTQPLGTRLADALQLLETHLNLGDTADQETLGLAGAIHKRMWDLQRNEAHLRKALSYYQKGSEQRPWRDQGYTSINAAYVLDLLASLTGNGPDAAELRARAQNIRREIVEVVPPMASVSGEEWLAQQWFYYSTVGEAHFGLGNLDEAIDWLVRRPEAAFVTPPDWEFETSARQIAGLVRAQHPADFAVTDAWKKFEEFLRTSSLGKAGDVSTESVRRLADGKIGLALSGGGFRASLFQIGVLAHLAELDVLRRVEVISCVSGGSIVGAHYYLEVRKLLQEKPDAAISKPDYIAIVRRLEENFLAGVQTNIRMSVFTDATIVRRMLRPDYSRTTRLGELYEERLYATVGDEARRSDGTARERYMHELVVRPRREDGQAWDDFKPLDHNWQHAAKVPILILNAATLNTGHNWQFTATYMGEAPATIQREIDSIYRLRRKYYTAGPHDPKAPQLVRLGAAVAASSCVPGLFEPLELKDAYAGRDRERIDVKLVDGGVCDNQGIAGLLEQDCTVLLVSDGSGQIDAVSSPGSASAGVLLRSDSILQARVRGTQYRDLDSRRHGSMLAGLMFVHLKKDLDNTPVDWTDCPPESRVAAPDDRLVQTTYNVPKDVQRRLAAIRTDLDTFCDQEADALMLSGYRMTVSEYRRAFNSSPVATEQWRFHRVAHRVDAQSPNDFTAVLDAAGSLFGKIWELDPALSRRAARLKKVGFAALLAILLVAVFAPGVLLWLAIVGASATAIKLLTGVGFIVAALAFGIPVLAVIAWCAVHRRYAPLPHFAMGVALWLIVSPLARRHMQSYEERYRQRGAYDFGT